MKKIMFVMVIVALALSIAPVHTECDSTGCPPGRNFTPIMPQPGENPRCILVGGEWRCKPQTIRPTTAPNMDWPLIAAVMDWPVVVYDNPPFRGILMIER